MIARQRSIFLSVTCLGISSLVTQIVTLREFLNILAGNELIIGLILANWLLLTGFGSYLGRFSGRLKHQIRWLTVFQTVIAFLPFLQISAIRLLKKNFVPGLMLDLHDAFLYSFFLLLPYCLVSGFLLTLFSSLGGERKDALQIGQIYVLDVIGDIIGGILFSFLLIYFLSPFQVLTFLLLLNLGAAIMVSHTHWGRTAVLPYMACLGIAITLISLHDLEKVTGQALFQGQKTLFQEATPYGNLAVTLSENQFTVYENGMPIGSSQNTIAAEESTHFALSQHSSPEKILLVSGGLNGALHEALKYPLMKIDYVELDPTVIKLVQKLSPRAVDERVRFIARDARHHIRSASQKYDAILIDLADPATAQLNRFYTLEFFKEAQRALRSNGILSFGLSGAENYANPEIRYLSSTIYRSLSEVFPNILIVPGERQYYVAGSNELDYNISEKLKEKNIATRYVNEKYLKARLSADRIALAKKMVSEPSPLNLDFRPASYFGQLQFWLSKFQGSLLLPVVVACAILIISIILISHTPRRAPPLAVTLSGFSGIGLEIILILAFQIIYGYVYRQIGIIFTAFLLGTALGSFWAVRSRIQAQKLFLIVDISLGFFSFFLVPFLLFLQASSSSAILQTVAPLILFPCLTVIIGFIVGAQFPLAARITFHGLEKTAGTLYGLDFLGAALGALLVSTFAVPILGLFNTCYLIGTLKVLTSLFLWLKRKEGAVEPAYALPAETSPRLIFFIVLLTFSGIGFLIYNGSTGTTLYSMSFFPPYHWLLLLMLAFGILQAMHLLPPAGSAGLWHNLNHEVFRRTKIGIIRWVYFFCFSLLIFFPIFRCYFKVPYLFCHVCPRQCIFGYLRSYLVPAALIMNIEKRFWCFHFCPIGTLFDCQARVASRPARLHKSWKLLPFMAFLFTVFSYFKISAALKNPGSGSVDWYTFFFKNIYTPTAIVIVITAFLILLAFKFRRSFCELLCPVGTLSDLLLKIERLPSKKRELTETE
ncbi:MAG: 4Fe-4S binding protein [Deltaproteobacteria bacterium]|jgi:spermidine synthase|nr:4Fe-4S binding protein [Deltaproteobacteria bacterium]